MEIFSEEKFTPLSLHPRANMFKAFDEQSAEVEVCDFIQKTIEIVKPHYVVETGSYRGILSSYICRAIDANGYGMLDTIEIDAALHLETRERLSVYDFAQAVHGSSLEFTPRQHIDVLVVDSLFALRVQEIIRYSPYMDRDTVIFCHDTSPSRHPTMRAILDDARRDMIVEEVHFYDTPRGLSQLRLCDRRGPRFFCLNMDHATERREFCTKEFAKAGLDVTFVRSFDTKFNGIRHIRPDYKVGHLGCCISHIHMIEEIGRYDHTGVVMEDDITLVEGFGGKLDAALATLPDGWEIAYIGWWPHFWNYTNLQTIEVNEHWLRITKGGVWGNYSYVINGRKGADKVLSVLQPISGHSDDVMHGAIVEGRLRGYYLKDTIAFFTDRFKSQTNGG